MTRGESIGRQAGPGGVARGRGEGKGGEAGVEVFAWGHTLVWHARAGRPGSGPGRDARIREQGCELRTRAGCPHSGRITCYLLRWHEHPYKRDRPTQPMTRISARTPNRPFKMRAWMRAPRAAGPGRSRHVRKTEDIPDARNARQRSTLQGREELSKRTSATTGPAARQQGRCYMPRAGITIHDLGYTHRRAAAEDEQVGDVGANAETTQAILQPFRTRSCEHGCEHLTGEHGCERTHWIPIDGRRSSAPAFQLLNS